MKAPAPRYCPARPFPAYTYIPGKTPHPISDPRGHSYGRSEPPPEPLTLDRASTNDQFLYAVDLFNHGYYWEAHEAWESLWHLAGRAGPLADLLKGLIKLAAAGVKRMEGRPEGQKRHARRAAELFRQASSAVSTPMVCGANLKELMSVADRLADQASECGPPTIVLYRDDHLSTGPDVTHRDS